MLTDYLSLVEDPRSHINREHDLVDVMFLVINGVLSGAEGWADLQAFGDEKLEWLRQFRPFKSGYQPSTYRPYAYRGYSATGFGLI